ncbi:MAG: DnaB-like helicase N-terminal domain-containing protein, partial [Coriobacteriia bacterium]
MADDGVQALRERVPPHNNEAEQSVLGSMFLSQDAVENCLALVEAEDFYRPQHQRIFGAIRDLHQRGEAVDQITVAARLESGGDLDAAGGKPYLLDIAGYVPSAANAEHYARIVKRTSLLRQLIGAGTAIQVMSYENPDDIDMVVERAEKAVFDVTNKRVSSR